MRALGGGEQTELIAALMDAYPLPQHLEMLLALRLGRSLAAIAPLNSGYEYVVFSVIRASESEGWTAELVLAACAGRPRNARLAAAAASLELVAKDEQTALERMVRPHEGIHDAEEWRRSLRLNERRVCRLEGRTPTHRVMGTAFLVRPNLLLTNFHVIEAVMLAGADGELQARFDLRVGSAGEHLLDGVVHALADEWLLASSPHADASAESLAVCAGDSTRLDYALIALASPVGEEALGIGSGAEAERGWIELLTSARAPGVGDQLMILQHPGDSALQIALGSVVDAETHPDIVRYQTNTMHGSSGAPCFAADWRLIALHQGASPSGISNQGISARAIAKDIERKRVGSEPKAWGR
jgi:hypothetical protein